MSPMVPEPRVINVIRVTNVIRVIYIYIYICLMVSGNREILAWTSRGYTNQTSVGDIYIYIYIYRRERERERERKKKKRL